MARAGTARSKHLLTIGAVLATALMAGCGGSEEKTYAAGPTAACLREHGEAPKPSDDPKTVTLDWAYLRFHPTIADAKAFDVSKLNTNFGGYEYHRKRYGNVSLVWATGGRQNVPAPGSDKVKAVEECLRA